MLTIGFLLIYQSYSLSTLYVFILRILKMQAQNVLNYFVPHSEIVQRKT